MINEMRNVVRLEGDGAAREDAESIRTEITITETKSSRGGAAGAAAITADGESAQYYKKEVGLVNQVAL